jgi:diaminopropionate ammonia-lyase
MPNISSLINTDAALVHIHNHFKKQEPVSTDDPLSPTACEQARKAISKWPGYQPTPLLQLTELAKRLEVSAVYCKDESQRFGLGSFKSLGGAYAVSVILLKHVGEQLGKPVSLADLSAGRHSELTRPITVCCATDGNHGRSVAWGAQQFGCKCVIYIHGEVSEGRKLAIEQYGATVIRIDGNYDDSIRIADEESAKHDRIVVSDTSYPGYMKIPADVMRGYTVLADEALDQLDLKQPTHVFLQGGVGGFAAAITRRIRDRCTKQQPKIVVVEPDQAACIYESIKLGEPVTVHGNLGTIMAGLACGEVSLIAFKTLLDEIDDVLVIPDETAISTMRFLATGQAGDAPLVSGESGVTGLAGFLLAKSNQTVCEKLRLDKNSRVLVISTEGATDPAVYEELVGMPAHDVV